MAHQSVYALLTKLCEALVQDSVLSSHLERGEKHRLVKKLRGSAFAALLKKSTVASSSSGLPGERLGALVRLRFLTLALHERTLQKQAARLHDCIDRIIGDGLASNADFMAVLLFLLSYVENSTEEAFPVQNNFQNYLDEFKVPYNNSYTNVRPYREFSPEMFTLPRCLLEQTHPRVNYASYQFLPTSASFPFSMEPGTGLPLLSRFIRKPKVDSHRFAPPPSTEAAFSIPELSSPRGLQIPELAATCQELMKDEGYGTPSQEFADVEMRGYGNAAEDAAGTDDAWAHALSPTTCDLRTWESLGEACPEREPGFLCEVSPSDLRHVWMVHVLERMQSGGAAPGSPPGQPRYLQSAQLLSHLKYLAAGIESTSFHYNQDAQEFEMERDVCMEGVAPGTFAVLCEDFVWCGTYCRRLHDLVCHEKPTRGFVYQAACRSVRAYLVLYRHVVLGSRASSLAQLRALLGAYAPQLACLSELLGAQRSTGRLLVHLCEQLRAVSRPDLTCLLCSVLLACCQAYFSFIEKWIFEGACSDTYGEFFIQPVVEFQCSCSRGYWSKGFAMDEREVPSFLQGLQDGVLQCAKTVALLKLCSPKDPLCVAAERGYPRMRCCVTKDSLAHLEAQFGQYEAACRLLCSEPVSVSQLLRRADLDLRAIQDAQRNRLLVRELERERRAAAARDGKQRLLAEQRRQIELARAHKQQEHAQREADDARLLAQQRQEETRLLRLERQALEQYYGALSEAAEKRLKAAETRIETAQEMQDNATQSQNTATMLPSPNNNTQESVLNIANIEHTTNRENTLTDDYVNNPIITTPNGNVHFPDVNSNSFAVARCTEDVDNSNEGVDLICHKLEASGRRGVVSNINVHAGAGQDTAPASPQRRAVPDNLPLGHRKYAPHSTPAYGMELSEAQRNKWKVLYEEFGMSGEMKRDTEASRKKRAASAACAETDLERNRNRVLHSSIAIGLSCREEPVAPNPPTPSSTTPQCASESVTVEASGTQDLDMHDVGLETGVPPEHFASDNGNSVLMSEADAGSKDGRADESRLRLDNVEESDPSVHGEQLAPVALSPTAMDAKHEVLRSDEYFEEVPELVDITGRVTATSDFEPLEQESVDMFFVQSALRKSVLVPLKAQAQLASSQLLRHLLVECELLSHLQSLHRFFFLLDGEFCRTVTCDLFERMYRAQRPSDLLNFATLGAVLSKALSASSTRNGSQLSFRISSVPEVLKHASPSVLGSLSLHYRVSWPLNIIITDSSLEKYNVVFAFLLKLRRIYWVMEQDFHWLKGARLTGRIDRDALLKSPQYHRLQLWRHDMMHFLCALQGYLLGAVQHESWAQFQRGLQSAHTLDQLHRLHALYIREVLQRCFLDAKSQPMETALQNLCRVILKFHGVLRGKQWVRRSGERCYRHPAFDRLSDTYKSFRHLCNFVYRLSVKIATRGYQIHIFGLLQVLNMNGYYGDENQVDHGCEEVCSS